MARVAPALRRHNASHALSLAALRKLGYRSENRYTVFQCLPHTLQLPAADWRVLAACYRRRNVAEYEGNSEIGFTRARGDEPFDKLFPKWKELHSPHAQ